MKDDEQTVKIICFVSKTKHKFVIQIQRSKVESINSPLSDNWSKNTSHYKKTTERFLGMDYRLPQRVRTHYLTPPKPPKGILDNTIAVGVRGESNAEVRDITAFH